MCQNVFGFCNLKFLRVGQNFVGEILIPPSLTIGLQFVVK